MNFFGGKEKARLTKNELIKLVLQHFANCQCEADTHTIRTRINGYIVTITRQVDEAKS